MSHKREGSPLKKKWSLFLFLSIIALLLVGCNIGEDAASGEKGKETEPITVEEQIVNVIKLNMEMAEKEDLDGYMATIDIDEEIVEDQRRAHQEFFDAYDIDYELLSAEVIEITETTAKVEIVQKAVATYVADGNVYNNHQVTANHNLTLVDGEWKISTTEVDENSIIYLDSNGEPIENTNP